MMRKLGFCHIPYFFSDVHNTKYMGPSNYNSIFLNFLVPYPRIELRTFIAAGRITVVSFPNNFPAWTYPWTALAWLCLRIHKKIKQM